MRTCTACALIIIIAVAANAQSSPIRKKLIEYGWDTPDCAYIRQHIREMEKTPFDGLIFHLPHWVGSASIFTKAKWDEAQFEQAFEDCRKIEWKKFTDNFIIVLAASDMDWFSDEDWEAVTYHLGIVAKCAALARCRGICFDAEPYGNNPWQYSSQPRASEKTFTEYEAIVRQRGAQFARVVQQHLPKAVIHTFFQLSLFPQIIKESSPEKRQQRLAQEGYGLLPAFLNGMLDAAGPGVRITDGNEPAYYYTSPKQYDDVRKMVKKDAPVMLAPENIGKYRKHMQMSQALYVDYVFGLGVWGQRSSPAPMLSPEDRARWFEHNTYHALRTADEFVWLYSEKMNWWTHTDLPPGLEQAVRSAKQKIAQGTRLGFEVAPLLQSAKDRRQAELRAKLITRSAEIAKLASAPPVIDGNLGDAAWQQVTLLDPFVPYVAIGDKAKVETRARVTYDDRNLYVAVRCPEPKVGEMTLIGERRDDPVWEGDSVDVFLSQGEAPTPHVHLILSPRNVQWDALFTDRNVVDFNPKWQSATLIGDAEWTAEIAIPWSEVKMKPPAPGERHRANVCRQRRPDSEQTSWSQTFDGFCEPENFGTWTFR
ncbi:MAG: hypothetical protein AUJ92_16625 [Armatimonadetes bacterium CG2_30_59_28]|nr:hypothetical protein [Armatimonadota bacterium]OIO91397.1 MAG: hypothetical protein AUJ92_16625 [Armatimonadetes bacterium CG2_30_59_28]PIU60678.1 MAG: hypothetical protein COS85_23210 [Armatimonadetes bacterium CG07_land_8_20_14_0_80_59_28]